MFQIYQITFYYEICSIKKINSMSKAQILVLQELLFFRLTATRRGLTWSRWAVARQMQWQQQWKMPPQFLFVHQRNTNSVLTVTLVSYFICLCFLKVYKHVSAYKLTGVFSRLSYHGYQRQFECLKLRMEHVFCNKLT